MLDKLLNLEGRIALVTGGGGGLGTAMALALARAGADIIITDFRPEAGEKTVAAVKNLGRNSTFFPADLTKSDEVNRMVTQAINHWGRVDILINCAGGTAREDRLPPEDRPSQPIWEITDRRWHLEIDTNLTSCFYCCRAIARHMVERKSGRIINVASGFGLRGLRNGLMYNTAKAGVIIFSRSLALTLARDNIRVNVISPGLFKTQVESGAYETRGPKLPMRRAGEPYEIGHLAVFLASDASNYATGETFTIDGGALADGYAPFEYAPVINLKEG